MTCFQPTVTEGNLCFSDSFASFKWLQQVLQSTKKEYVQHGAEIKTVGEHRVQDAELRFGEVRTWMPAISRIGLLSNHIFEAEDMRYD